MDNEFKILCLVMHGSNCSDRYYNVVNTWGKNIDTIFFSDHEDSEKKIIKTTNRKDYLGLEEKIINLFFKLDNYLDLYDWFLLCDDDTFVNIPKLEEFIRSCDEKLVYGKVLIHGYSKDPSLIFCSGGGGTLIHKSNMKLMSHNMKCYGHGIADVGLCMNLRDLNIQVENCDLFYSVSPFTTNLPHEDFKNYITFHHIRTIEEMYLLENKLKK